MKKWLSAFAVLVVAMASLVATFSRAATAPDDDVTVQLPIILRDKCFSLSDDFSDAGSGWLVEETAQRKLEYLDGEYRMLIKVFANTFSALSPTCLLENYEVQADVRWSGTAGQWIGVVFGSNLTQTEYYAFAVRVDKQGYNVFKVIDGVPSRLIDPTPTSSAVNPSGANTLTVTVDSTTSTYTFKINDTVVATPGGIVITGPTAFGVVGQPAFQVPVDARYDNFSALPLP